MFGKNLLRRLFEYLRRLWLFLITVIATAIFSYLGVLYDSNSYEMTGLMSIIALFVFAAFGFVGAGITHAILAFKRSISSTEAQDPKYKIKLLWVHIVAFFIFMTFAALFILGGVSLFAWDAVVQMFSSFSTEWPYFLEFIIFFIIAVFTVFILPANIITVVRLGKQINLPVKRVLPAAIVTFYLAFIAIIMEIFLLAWHNDTTVDMPFLCGMLATSLALIIFFDIRAYVLTHRTLKNSLQEQTDR